MRVACLIPTYHRPDGLKRVLQTLKDTSPSVHPVVAIDKDDPADVITFAFNVTLIMMPIPGQGGTPAWNAALAAEPDYDAYVLGADDVYFLPGWLESTMRALDSIGGSGLVGLEDRLMDKRVYSTHFLMTRDFIIQYHGGVMAIPWYKGWGVDSEACMRARNAKKYVVTKDLCIVHDWHGSATDNHRKEAKHIFKERGLANFPDDFEAIIK